MLDVSNTEIATDAFYGMSQAFGRRRVVVGQSLLDVCGRRALLIHELPQKFQIELPVSGHSAQPISGVETFDCRKAVVWNC